MAHWLLCPLVDRLRTSLAALAAVLAGNVTWLKLDVAFR